VLFDSSVDVFQQFLRGLPLALSSIYDELKHFQGLLGGLLALAAAWVLSHAILKGSRLRSNAIMRAALIAQQTKSQGSRRFEAPTTQAINPQYEAWEQSLHDLRNRIRSALSLLSTQGEDLEKAVDQAIVDQVTDWVCNPPKVDVCPRSDEIEGLFRALGLLKSGLERHVPLGEVRQALLHVDGLARRLLSR
jgi:hypothetical protein